jgi:hypothetical protein
MYCIMISVADPNPEPEQKESEIFGYIRIRK